MSQNLKALNEAIAHVERWLLEEALEPEESASLLSLLTELRAARNTPISVVLCAMFQSGKSTTVNTLLGGHEISLSSIDSGMRTSTGRIALHPAPEEQTDIRWLSVDDLAAQITALSGIAITAGDLTYGMYNGGPWRRLTEVWNRCLKQGDRDALLHIGEAGILMAYATSETLRGFRQQPRTPYETSRMMTALSDETQRWLTLMEQGPAEGYGLKNRIEALFPLEDVAFMFVDRIDVRVPSPVLRALDASLIDIPGLGVSARDNRLAWETVSQADLVMYIFDGEREPSEMERGFVHELRGLVGERPVLFAVNRRGRAKEAVEQSVRLLIEECGWVDAPLMGYHARLANCAAHGRLMRQGDLDQATREVIMARARRMDEGIGTVEDAWTEIAADALAKFDRQAARKVRAQGVCDETVALISGASGWDGLVDAMREVVVPGDEAMRFSRFAQDRVVTAMERTSAVLDKLRQVEEPPAPPVDEAALNAALTRIIDPGALRECLRMAMNSGPIRDYASWARTETIAFLIRRFREEQGREPSLKGLDISVISTMIAPLTFPNWQYRAEAPGGTWTDKFLRSLSLTAGKRAVDVDGTLDATVDFVRGSVEPVLRQVYGVRYRQWQAGEQERLQAAAERRRQLLGEYAEALRQLTQRLIEE